MGIVKQMWLEELDARGEQYPDEWEEPDPLRIVDMDRRMRHTHHEIQMTTDEIEFRYERRGDDFMIKSWHDGKEVTVRGRTYQLPHWLVPILSVAKVSGHLHKTVQPPPDEILWFRTDTSRNLTCFIDLEDPK